MPNYARYRTAPSRRRPSTIYRKPAYSQRKSVSSYRRSKARSGFKRKYSRSHPGTRLNQGDVYHYKRTLDYGNVVFATGANTYAAYSFKLNDLPDYTEFTQLYDSYKFSGVTMHYYPQQTQDDASSAANTTGLMHSVIDYDDATAPTTINELMEYQNHKITPFNHQLRRFFKPKAASAVYTTSFVGFENASGWLDCANPDIAHYGFKTGLNTVSSGASTGYRLFMTYYVKFKAVR